MPAKSSPSTNPYRTNHRTHGTHRNESDHFCVFRGLDLSALNSQLSTSSPMALAKITSITGRAVPVVGNDIDTDRIIPARFMKCVTFDGLGEFLFYDVRKDPTTGQTTNHPLNDPRFTGGTILLSGANFGCGSSREHAPQAIQKYGFKAIIAESYAEIFFGNSTTLGMPCVTAAREDIAKIAAAVEKDPQTE